MVWSGQAAQHDPDHRETEEGGDGSRVAFEVAGQAAVAADPGKGALDDPALRQDDKAMGVAALDDVQGPGTGLGDYLGHLWPLVAGVGEDAFDERKGCRAVRSRSLAPSRSCTLAGWTATLNMRPSVSTRIWRLRPVTFLPASKPCGSSAEPPFEPPCRSGCR